MDLFEKLRLNRGPLGTYAKEVHGYFTFPKLVGDISPRMVFKGKEKLNWSLNNYLGLANHPEVRKADAEAGSMYGLAMPMGARMMSGDSDMHELLEKQLAEFVQKEDSILLNFGYQGIFSAIDALVDRQDVIIYDAESHACIVDGLRLHLGKHFVFGHNDISDLEKQLKRAELITRDSGGAVLVITEGVFGMSGDQGNLREIVALKQKFNFRLFVDDAHGLGTMGSSGAGTGEEQGVQQGIDLYFATFAKSMATIGAFIASDAQVIEYLRYNMRSQIFAKSLPTAIVAGAIKRLELIRLHPEWRSKLWEIVHALQSGLKSTGLEIGKTQSPVTPVYLQSSIPESANLIFDLRENFHVFCSLVVYPVVPRGIIMLRLIPTAIHSMEDVQYTIDAFKAIKLKLNAGQYKGEMATVL